MARNWKRIQPSSLRDALRLCKDHALEKKNYSVERIADLMGITADLLYKWLANEPSTTDRTSSRAFSQAP